MRTSADTERIIKTWLDICTAGNYRVRDELQYALEHKPRLVLALYYAVLDKLAKEQNRLSESGGKKKSHNLAAIMHNSSPVELGKILEDAVGLLEKPSNEQDILALQRLKYELLVVMNLYVLNGNNKTDEYAEMIEAIAANYDDGEKQDTKRLIRAGVPRPRSWYFQNVEPGSEDQQAINHEGEINDLNDIISEKPAVNKANVDVAIQLFSNKEYIEADALKHLNLLWDLCQQDLSIFRNDQLIKLVSRIEQSINPFISELYEVVTKNLKLDSVTKLKYLMHIQVLQQAFKEIESQIVDAMLERLLWVPDEVIKELSADQHKKTLTNSKWLQVGEATNKFIHDFLNEKGYTLDKISLTQIIKYLLYIGSKGSADQKRQIHERLPIKKAERKSDWLDGKLSEWQLICPDEIKSTIWRLVNTKVIETNLESRYLQTLLININQQDQDNVLKKSLQIADKKGMLTTKEQFNTYVRLSGLFGKDDNNIELLPLFLTVCNDGNQIAEIQDVYSNLRCYLDEADFSMVNDLLKSDIDYFKDYNAIKGFLDQLLRATSDGKKMELVRNLVARSILEHANPVKNLDFLLNEVMGSGIEVTSQFVINHLQAAQDIESFKKNILNDASAIADRPILSLLYQFFDNETVNRIISDTVDIKQNCSSQFDSVTNNNLNQLMNLNERKLMQKVTPENAEIIHLVMASMTLDDELKVTTCLKASIEILQDVVNLLKSVRMISFTAKEWKDFCEKLISLMNQLRTQIHADVGYSEIIRMIINTHLDNIENAESLSKQGGICLNLMKLALAHTIEKPEQVSSLIKSTTELLADLEQLNQSKEETAMLELVNDGLKLLLQTNHQAKSKKGIQHVEKSLEKAASSLHRKQLVKSFWSSFLGLFGVVFDSAKRLSQKLAEQSKLFGEKSRQIKGLSSGTSELRGKPKRS